MAEEQDESQKTEEATPRKLEKAHAKGQAPVSQEVKTWAIILAGAMALAALGPPMMKDVMLLSTKFIEQPHAIPFDDKHLQLVFYNITTDLALALWPVFLFLMLIAVLSNIAQVGLVWAASKIKPELSKISLLKGLKRMFSMRALVEFAKGILKLVVVAIVAFGMAIPMLDDLVLVPQYSFGTVLDRLMDISLLLLLGTLGVLTVIAVIDYIFQRYTFLKQMRMTKQEVKDEHKQTEGDPLVKGRIRKLRHQRAQQRMMAAVPNADVVITNPTHYAVALEYKMDDMMAPKLVAKGVDDVAFRIRSVAEENDVPVVENPPLARALFASVDLDEEIPGEHYKAVAEVIGYVMRLRGSLPSDAAE